MLSGNTSLAAFRSEDCSKHPRCEFRSKKSGQARIAWNRVVEVIFDFGKRLFILTGL